MMKPPLIGALIGLQLFVVLFVALHDWVQLGALNNLSAVKRSDPTHRLILVTALSTFPFAVGLAATVSYARATFPGWLMGWLWISYGVAAFGALRTWWIPYLLFTEPDRVTRYQQRFAGIHAFLPVHNGIRPDTLHCILHGAICAVLALLCVRGPKKPTHQDKDPPLLGFVRFAALPRAKMDGRRTGRTSAPPGESSIGKRRRLP